MKKQLKIFACKVAYFLGVIYGRFMRAIGYKIRFIVGMLATAFIGSIYIGHVKMIGNRLNQGFIGVLDWFLCVILFHVVFFILANFSCVHIKFPQNGGETSATVISWLVFVFGMPIIYIVKLVMFIINGGLSEIFPPSEDDDEEYDDEYDSKQYSASESSDTRSKNGILDLERGLRRICSGYRREQLYGANLPSNVELYCNGVSCRVDVPYSGNKKGVIHFDIEYLLVGYEGCCDLRDLRDRIEYFEFNDLYSDVGDLIEKLRKTCNGLDCAWDYDPRISIEYEYRS